MNPWKIIGWIVLVLMVLFLAFCSLVLYRAGDAMNKADRSMPIPAQANTSASSATTLPLSVQVVSFECIARPGRDKAEMTVRNTGATTISFTKLFVEFKNSDGSIASASNSYFSPHDIPPGSVASTTVYSNGGGARTCEPSAIQDRDGRPVSFSK